MIRRAEKIFSLFTLVPYVLVMVVHVAFHHDLDGMGASGRESIAAHADADHCRHVDVSHAEPCAICSGLVGKSSVPVTPFDALIDLSTLRLVDHYSYVPSTFGVLVPFFRRGPPSIPSL